MSLHKFIVFFCFKYVHSTRIDKAPRTEISAKSAMLTSISVLLLSLYIVGQATSLSLEEDLSRPLPRRGVERSHIFSVLSTYSLHIVGQATSLSLEKAPNNYRDLEVARPKKYAVRCKHADRFSSIFQKMRCSFG